MRNTIENPSQSRLKYRLDDVKTAARGRWPEILMALGVAEHYTDTRKHQPCPYCGGKDRYRFTDHKQGGGFICNHCTPDGGSGFDLLMLLFGYSFREAVQAVAGVLGMGGGRVAPAVMRAAPKQADTAQEDEKKRARLAELWNACQAWDETPLIADYLHGRGVPLPEQLPISRALRLHSRLAYWHKGRILGHFPAMVGAFRDKDGNPRGLHITYLQRRSDGLVQKAALFDPQTRERLPAKKMQSVHTGSLSGAAIRLFMPENGVLGICEGIETAVAARYVSGVAMWACGSAHGIKTFELPKGIKELIVIADNDSNQAGITAARALQRRCLNQLDSFKIWRPDTVGADALDVLAAYTAKGVSQ